MIRAGTYVALALTALLGVYVGGIANPFTAWNLVPLAVVAVVQYHASQTSLAAIGFAIATCAIVAVAHLAWLFDWGGTATGSSTAGLMFVTLPIVALVAGSVGWLAGWASGRVLSWRARQGRDTE
jgi:uncharacterized membrane protein YjgN (DUF898 family)